MVYKAIIDKKTNEVAKRTREAFFSIPFYSEKLKQYGIPKKEIRKIRDIKSLNQFLDKYSNAVWISEEDLVSYDFSAKLSRVPPEKRTWLQATSGYFLAEKISNLNFTSPSEMLKALSRKKVAFTKKDVEKVIDTVFKPGLKELIDVSVPTLAIIARFGDLCGSGTYPLLALGGNFLKTNPKILYFGEPTNSNQLLQWAYELYRINPHGILSTPIMIEKLSKAIDESFSSPRFSNLKFVSLGAMRPLKSSIDAACNLGAEVVVDGYGLQEVAPLGVIAKGIVFSSNKKVPPTDGLIGLGTLHFIRVVDKEGKSVNPGEEGTIKVTSPFDGTTLIDYDTKDMGKLLANESCIIYRSKNFKVPWPLLDFKISRKIEYSIDVVEHRVSTTLLEELCSTVSGYSFLVGSDINHLYIFFPDDAPDLKIEKFKKMVSLALPAEVSTSTRIYKVKKELMEKYLHPINHYKPHNLIRERSKIQELVRSSR